MDDSRVDGIDAADASGPAPTGSARASVAPDRTPAAPDVRRGFVSRYRLPLLLAAIALCGYVGSIVYIVYVRGQVG